MSSPSSPEQGAAAAAAADVGIDPAGAGGHLRALGQRLRQAREARDLSATVLADRLRLGVEQLEALESADRERLPEPVFVIAQARRVAGALGLDITPELQALRISGELQPRPRPGALRLPRPLRPPVDADAPLPAAQPQAPRWLPARPGSRLRSLGRPALLAGALLLLLALLWAGWRLRGSVAGGDDPPPSPAGELRQGAPRPSSTAASPPVAAGPAAAAVAAGMVVLASREPSWVEVRRPDGTILFRGMLRGARLFSLEPGLEVMAARPDLVSSRSGSAAAQTLGPISDVRWRSLAAAP